MDMRILVVVAKDLFWLALSVTTGVAISMTTVRGVGWLADRLSVSLQNIAIAFMMLVLALAILAVGFIIFFLALTALSNVGRLWVKSVKRRAHQGE